MVVTVGMRTYQRIKDVEREANNLGFKFKTTRFISDSGDWFVLITDGDRLPCYRENSEMFKGNLDEVESFLEGISWARRYDLALGLKTDQRRTKSEQRIRNRQLVNTIKNSNRNEEDDPPF